MGNTHKYKLKINELGYIYLQISQSDENIEYKLSLNPSNTNFSNNISTVKIENIFQEFIESDSITKKRLIEGKEINLRFKILSQTSIIESHMLEKTKTYFLQKNNELQLYNYQKEGVEFLLSKNKAILADDMGTGKTLQSITAFKTLIDEGILINCLVICPNTLIKNWEKEIIQWSPELQYSIIDPEYKDKNIYWKESLKKTNVIICSYEQIKIAPKFIFDMKHKLIIADEAHKIRKQSSGINQQFSKLRN